MPMPIFLQPRMLLTAAAALALSACFGTPDAMKGGGTKRSGGATAQRPQTTGAPSFTSAAARQCAVDLRQAGVKFTPLPNEDHGGGCSSSDSVKLLDSGTPVTNRGPMPCPLARNFAAWVEIAFRPGARRNLRTAGVKGEHPRKAVVKGKRG